MDNLILKRRAFVAEQIQKSFDNDIEKAAHGVYEDNAENRRLNRVGQEYGHAAKEGEPAAAKRGKGDEPKSVGDLVKQRATEASTEALKRASKDESAKPEVREAAKKELANRGGNDSVKEKPSKAKKQFIKDALEHGGSSSLDRFMEKNKEHFSDVLKKHGFENLDDFNEWGENGGADENPKKYDKVWKDCLNAIPNSAFGPEDEPKSTSNEKESTASSRDDVKAFLSSEAGEGVEVTDEMIDKVISDAKEKAKKHKEAVPYKKQRINSLTEYGANKDDDKFLKENEEHFSDVLKKHGFDSFDEFLDWGMEIDSDDDLDKYDRIYLKCFKSIPAENYLPEDKQ